MRVHGELLTPDDCQQVKAPFRKNEGRKWDLHEMSLYAEKGYQAIAADSQASEMLKKGMESLRGGRKDG